MKKQTLLISLWIGTAFWSGVALAASVQERLAAQNALFDEQFETDLKNHPEVATAFGDYRYNDQLNDYSLAGAARQHQLDQDFLARLQRIPVAGFSGQDVLSHQVMQQMLDQRIANFGFKEYEMPVDRKSVV